MGRIKVEIQTEQQARAYIKKVLDKWTEFGKWHAPLKQALEIVLKNKERKENELRK